jgi:hypothetical protein
MNESVLDSSEVNLYEVSQGYEFHEEISKNRIQAERSKYLDELCAQRLV